MDVTYLPTFGILHSWSLIDLIQLSRGDYYLAEFLIFPLFEKNNNSTHHIHAVESGVLTTWNKLRVQCIEYCIM